MVNQPISTADDQNTFGLSLTSSAICTCAGPIAFEILGYFINQKQRRNLLSALSRGEGDRVSYTHLTK
jgi:hypothetical protein